MDTQGDYCFTSVGSPKRETHLNLHQML